MVDASRRPVICGWLAFRHGHRQGVGRAGVPAGGRHPAPPDPVWRDRAAPAGALDQNAVPDLRNRAGYGDQITTHPGGGGLDPARTWPRLVRGARTIKIDSSELPNLALGSGQEAEADCSGADVQWRTARARGYGLRRATVRSHYRR